MAARKKKPVRRKRKTRKKPVRRADRVDPANLDPRQRGIGWHDLVETVATMIARRVNPDSILRAISLRVHGPIDDQHLSTPTKLVSDERFAELMSAANQHIIDTFRTGDPVQTKALAIATYEEVLRDPGAKAQDRIAAQKRIDELLGHDHKSSTATSAEEFVANVMRAFREADESVPTEPARKTPTKRKTTTRKRKASR